jgi:hypothetical protein
VFGTVIVVWYVEGEREGGGRRRENKNRIIRTKSRNVGEVAQAHILRGTRSKPLALQIGSESWYAFFLHFFLSLSS